MNKKEKLKEMLHNRKFVYALAAGIFVFFFIAWLIIHFTFPSGEKSSPFSNIPQDAAMVLEIRQPKTLWAELSVNSGVWREIINIYPFTKINSEVRFLDSLFNTNDCATKIISRYPVYISFHSLTAGTTGFLYLTTLPGGCNKTVVEELIKQATSDKATFAERSFMGADITEVSFPSKKEKFNYTISKDIFICSFQPALVEAAMKQQQSGLSLEKNAGFLKVAGTAGKKVNANLYINFNCFPSFLSSLASSGYTGRLSGLAGFAGWSALDVNVKKDAILFNGFCNAETNINFSGLFASQEPQETEMLNIIPSSTASFVHFGFSNFSSWYKSYIHYLEKKGKLSERNAKISVLNDRHKTNIEKSITSWVGKEMALVITEPSDSNIASNMFAVIKADNIEKATTLLAAQSIEQVQKAIPKKQIKEKKGKKKPDKVKGKKKKSVKQQQVQQQKVTPSEIKNNKIYEYKVSGVLPALFGKLFEGVEGTFYAVVDDYVIFANSSKALESFLKDYSDEKTLRDNKNYISFSKNISNESNIYLYCNIKKSLGLFAKYASPGIVSYIGNNLQLFKNIDAFAYQLKSNGKFFYNTVCLKSNTGVIEESDALWAVSLDSTVFLKPQLVSGNDNKTKNIIAFDDACNMYMIDGDGSLLWKVQLKEKPVSETVVVDYYKNGKNEYMFNTLSYIYLISADGKNIENFPVKLPETSTAPMTVVDYAGNKDYRLIVPCGNKVFNYLKNGSVNTAYLPLKTKSEICKKVTSLKINGVDYLVVSDKDGTIYITDKKGTEKIKIRKPFIVATHSAFYLAKAGNASKQGILTTDNIGNMVFIFPSGDVEVKTVTKFSPLHYFIYGDFNNDRSNEYIFLDDNKLSVFNAALKPLCSYTFPLEISTAPALIENAGINCSIGAVSVKGGKIFLLKQNCSLWEGFPLNGTTPFSVGSLNNEGSSNLIVGSGRKIYNYSLE